MKNCSICKEEKPMEDFYKSRSTKDGRTIYCNICFRERTRDDYLMRNYGIVHAEYLEILEGQNGGCAICGKKEDTETKYKTNKFLAVDHCHKTGDVRGILCENCNRGIGLFQENQSLLAKGIEYLNQFS